MTAQLGNMRREFLKGYVAALLTEGRLSGSPAEMARQAVGVFAEDLPAVLADMGRVLAEQSGNQLGAVVLGKLGDVVQDVANRGWKSVWRDLKAQYERGLDAKYGKR